MNTLGLVLVLGGLVLVVAGVWAVATYNGLVRLRNLVQEAWRQIEVELHRRHDLVPDLVETVRGHAGHERALFEEVARARAAATEPGATPAHQAHRENELTAALGRLFAVAEGYPQLRADGRFVQLHSQLTETEDRIGAGRRFYNANVRQLNTRIETFPANAVAALLGFHPSEYFEANDPAVRSAPVADVSRRADDVGSYRAPAGPDDGGRPVEGDLRG